MGPFGANCQAASRRCTARVPSRRWLAFTTAAGAITCVCLGAAQAPSVELYHKVVRAYRQGQYDSACRDAAGLDQRLIEQAIGAITRAAEKGRLPDTWSLDDVRGAVVLHSELAVRAAVRSGPERTLHVALARRLAETLTDISPSPARVPATAREFLRQWHLFLARQAQGILALDEAAADLDVLTQRFGADAEVLLTAGTLAETLAWPALAESLDRPLATPRQKRSRMLLLADAEQSFRRAAQLDPRADEARLRLGRVLIEQGRYADALASLEATQAHARDVWVQYLGRLFSGAACERLDRWDEAEAHYLAARQLQPGAQSGMIALGFARQRLGRFQGAADALRPLVRQDGRGMEDPWWEYYFGQWRRLPDMLEALRLGVRE